MGCGWGHGGARGMGTWRSLGYGDMEEPGVWGHEGAWGMGTWGHGGLNPWTRDIDMCIDACARR